ncbi:unnamed protein product [Gordionus sp. m RMFG-2023]|uniref:uncharacterized protein LOC135931664 n=1 Tax=Gordionus sp. m RMFG-2023 TaxID=3053472 RepID=UPI0030DE06E4
MICLLKAFILCLNIEFFITLEDSKFCIYRCKFSKTCYSVSQKCDEIVDCCTPESKDDQTDESDCGTILSPKPPSIIETLEGRNLQITFNILQNYTGQDYQTIWLINDVYLNTNAFLDNVYQAQLTEGNPKSYIFTIFSPEISMNNMTLTFQIIDRRRTYESVCNRKASMKGSFDMKLLVRKRPDKPVISLQNRPDPAIGNNFILTCTSREGYVRPTISWVKTFNDITSESSQPMIADILDDKKVSSSMQINSPQKYAGTALYCKTNYVYLNESMSDQNEPIILNPPKIQYISAEGELIVKFGSALNLTCSASGFPPPFYKWAYSSSPIVSTTSPKSSQPKKAGSSIGNIFSFLSPLAGGKNKLTYIKKEYVSFPDVSTKHSGYYQCIVYNELGESVSPVILVSVPDPSLGFLSTYFTTKESLIGFVMGIIIFIIIVGLIMFFVYGKVARIVETRNKLLMEQAAEAKRKADEGKKGKRKGANDPQTPIIVGGRKILKGPPALTDAEQPFISAMDQPVVFPTEDDMDLGGMTKFDDANFVPPAFSRGAPIVNRADGEYIPQFEYPDDDDALMMNMLKK